MLCSMLCRGYQDRGKLKNNNAARTEASWLSVCHTYIRGVLSQKPDAETKEIPNYSNVMNRDDDVMYLGSELCSCARPSQSQM
jgi:hypothetical protein